MTTEYTKPFVLSKSSAHDAVAVCAGELKDTVHLARLCRSAKIVAAVDAGYERLKSAGISPSLWLGDGDSYSGETPECQRIEFDPDKDRSDTELMVLELLGRGHQSVALACATGGRLDHTFANLQLLVKYPLRTFLTEPDTLAFGLSHKMAVELFSFVGHEISVFALGEPACGVGISGTKWPMARQDLLLGTLGLSNVIVQETASISVESGCLLVFINLGDER